MSDDINRPLGTFKRCTLTEPVFIAKVWIRDAAALLRRHRLLPASNVSAEAEAAATTTATTMAAAAAAHSPSVGDIVVVVDAVAESSSSSVSRRHHIRGDTGSAAAKSLDQLASLLDADTSIEIFRIGDKQRRQQQHRRRHRQLPSPPSSPDELNASQSSADNSDVQRSTIANVGVDELASPPSLLSWSPPPNQASPIVAVRFGDVLFVRTHTWQEYSFRVQIQFLSGWPSHVRALFFGAWSLRSPISLIPYKIRR